MLEHTPQSFSVGEEVLYMGDQWRISQMLGEDCTLVSTSNPDKKSVVAKSYDLSHVAVYDDLADEFDDDDWDSRRDSLLPRP